MSNIKYTIFFALVLTITAFLCVLSCTKPPDYPKEPVIKYLRMTKKTMKQSDLSKDTTFVTVAFTDGDGDIGDKDSLNVFLTDKRDGFRAFQFRVPTIPTIGVGNGISGEMTFAVYTSCCYFPQNKYPPCTRNIKEYPTDNLIYQIFIKDRAGNKSNTIDTEAITLLCQ
jgi:hypothetical protein